MAVNMKGKSIKTIAELSREEVLEIISTGEYFKRLKYTNTPHKVLEGKTLAMIFQKPSLRTRVSFETAMTQLGGHAIYLGPKDIKLGERETIEDIAKTLSRYVDGIMARVFGHYIIDELAKYATVPVINGLSDYTHPCQILGDFLTIKEKIGCLCSDIKLAFIGAGNNVCHSLLFAATKLGLNISVACPKGFEPKEQALEIANKQALSSGSKIEILHDKFLAVKDADVIYTDVWASMGEESEREARKKIFKDFQVDLETLKKAKPDTIVMHCLPAHYGEEITKEVVDSPKSVIFDQAENRLHIQKAILALLL